MAHLSENEIRALVDTVRIGMEAEADGPALMAGDNTWEHNNKAREECDQLKKEGMLAGFTLLAEVVMDIHRIADNLEALVDQGQPASK